jgi:transposase
VDRASLEQLLGRGLSLAEIGRRFGLHESTVGYWVERYETPRMEHGTRGGAAYRASGWSNWSCRSFRSQPSQMRRIAARPPCAIGCVGMA